MSRIRFLPTRAFAFLAGRRFHSLSTGILVAMCVGLLLPALFGGLALTNLNEGEMNREMEAYLRDKILLVANSLANQVWNYDTNAATAIADAALLDPQVVRISVTVGSAEQIPFISMEKPERRLGKSQVASHKLELSGETIGHVEMEVDDGLRKLAFEQGRRAYSQVLLGQFILALTLILMAIRFWVLKPLARLSEFSTRLASGDLEHPMEWTRFDEIGRLARQLDQMRSNLLASFAEEQAILNNVQVGVVFVREQTIQLANRHAEQIFGYAPGKMHGLASKAIYLEDEQYSTILGRAAAAISTNSGRYEDELQLRHNDGSIFWAYMRGCALNPDKPQAGSIWVFEDISARKAIEAEIHQLNQNLEQRVTERTAELQLTNERLSQAMEQLVQSEKLASLGNLVAGVAHELNTPLGNTLISATTLKSQLQDLAKRVESGQLRKSDLDAFISLGETGCDLIERNANRAANLIGNFKQVAVDQTSEQRRSFDLRRTVEEVVTTMKPIFHQQRHAITIDIPEGITLDSFPGPLDQVITNLISNSNTHGFPPGIRGHMLIAANLINEREVSLILADDGVGIPAALQSRVFDPFYTTRLGHGGSGLGLYIVYTIVTSLLGGHIQLVSIPNGGTSFIISLPLTAPERDPLEQVEMPGTASVPTDTTPPNQMNVVA